MGEVVNLNQVRKQKARETEKKTAEENRVRHGQTREQRKGLSAKFDQLRRALDGSRLETDEAGGPSSNGSSNQS